jgi:hypothetical protein
MIIEPEKKVFGIALCPGGPADTSGLAVVQSVRPPDLDSTIYCPPDSFMHYVRYLHRFPPGTRYSTISQMVARILDLSELSETEEVIDPTPAEDQQGRGAKILPRRRVRKVAVEIYLVIDQTGVGEPGAREIQRLVGRQAHELVIEGRHREAYAGGLYHVPKQILIGGIDVSLERCNFKIAEGMDETKSFAQELINFQNRPSASGASNPDIWRDLPTYDLIFATAIACWKLRSPRILRCDWI